ncbi:hypothetical protein SAMN02745216_01498 [Desulfatibacillum alkenivorans DSM 16219]|jgi:hypothetical protein|uniref:Uncharacterized protein n=1 Tax=Desulfatibacillum alkenivorans DSM 16219 TaxID=1121393 RepID=A0A1M6IIX8_9BACT|nr:hypothetical protein [Desulfatibacillum alkenivorans]SHJ34386.1 hypothetical protein SAMN02745216_01498 [Desulfatibacillum alkenivorans DSM 16219]
MGVLYDVMLNNEIHTQVVSDYAALISNQVQSTSGPSGMVIKTGYKALKGVKPGYIEEMVEILLPSFMTVLDKHYEEYNENGAKAPYHVWIEGRSPAVADQLLEITDEVIQHADKKVVVKVYKGVRKIAKKHVAAAIPDMAAVTMKYMD